MPAPYSAGSIFLQVVPSFRGVPEQIAREAREWPDRITDGFDEKLEKNVREAGKKAGKALGDELEKGAGKSGDEAGKEYAGRFRESLRKGIASAQRELNTTPLKLALNDDGLRKSLDKIRKDFGELDRKVKLGMDSGGALMELRRLLTVLDKVKDSAQNVELRSNVASIHRDLNGVLRHIEQLSATDIEPKLKIDRQLGVFERRLKAGIKSALDDLPPLTIDDGPAYAQVEALRETLQSLDRKIDLGVDSSEAFTEFAAVGEALHELADTAESMKLRVDAASVHKTVATVRSELESLSRITIEPEIEIDRQMGAFERAMKSAVSKALGDIGTVDGLAATDPQMSDAGQRQLIELRRQLEELDGLRLGIDISDETARQRLTSIRNDLEQLQREHWSIRMDADTAAASAALSGVLAAMEAIDGRHVDIDIDVKDAVSAVNTIRAVDRETRKAGSTSNDAANSFRAFNIRVLGVAALGPLVVPALAAIAGGIAALLPLAAAGGAAIGVLVLGLMGVGDAVKAMGDARSKAGKDAQDYEKGVRTANAGIADAERGLSRAREQAASANAQAGRQVEDALRGVEDAERGVREAQREAQRAQEDLTRARADAAEQMEDLRLAVEGGALAERDAILDLREAQRELAAARAEGVTGDNLERFILSVDQADLALRRAKESNGDLTAEAEKWARTGVEGSDRVVSAQQRVEEANARIADAERGVADANRAVADARAQQAQTAIEGQRSIADAQRSLTEAQQTYTEAIGKTSSAQDKLTESMSKLGPAGREFATYLDNLRPRFQNLRGLAQEGFLPGLTDWIDSIVSYHGPLLESTVARMGGAIGGMFSQFATSLRGEEFTAFFRMIERSGPTFVGMMGSVLTNLGQGVASLTVAMEPLGYLFGQWLVDATDRFNQWANSLQGSTGLASFFQYVADITPKVADFIWNLADALVQVGIALAPYAEGLLNVLDNLLAWVAQLDPSILGPIAAGLVLVVLGLQAIFGLTALAKSFEAAAHLTATTVGRLSTALFGWIAIAAIVAVALYDLYRNSDEFRGAIDSIWDVIQPLASFMSGAFSGILRAVSGLISTFSTEIGLLAVALVSLKIVSLISTLFSSFGTMMGGQVAGQVAGLRYQMGLFATGVGVHALETQAAAGRIAASYTAAMRAVVIQSGGAMGAVGALRTQLMGLTAAAAAAGTVGMGALTRGAKGLVSMLGGPWGVALLAGMVLIGQWMSMTRQAEEQENKWAEALGKGGKAARDAVADYKRERDERPGFEWMKDLDEWTGVASSIDDARRAQREYFQGLSPLEQAESKVAEWTATHADRVGTLGKNHEDTRTAAERLAYWTAVLEGRQSALDLAITGTNEALLEQQNRAISLAEASISFAQSEDSLAQAHQRAADALRDNGAESREYKDALAAIESQSMATAQAAGRVAESRHLDADAAEKQQWANAAILANLIAQEEKYGALPPRLQELKDSLAATVPEAYKVATGFEDLGLQISKTPSEHGIVVTSTTQEQRDLLSKLGFEVRELEDGEFEVVAKTEDAQLAIDDLLKPRTLIITPEIKAVNDAIMARRERENTDFQDSWTAPRAAGGVVYGPGTGTSDSILARLSNGEYVVKAASVNKYGLGFLESVNSGRYPTPAFRDGGLVGLPKFADGGFVASYGGTINLSGAAIPELAAFWVDALTTINEASNQAATNISRAFSGLRTALLGNFGATHTEATSIWGSLFATITGQAEGARGLLGTIFGGLRDDTTARSTETRDRQNGLWGEIRDLLTGRSQETRDNVNGKFGGMRDDADTRASELSSRVRGHFDGLPGFLATPINKIIDAVLNNGLFKAFNAVVGALGLDQKFNIPTIPNVKLATGGRVPGYSPHDKADNVPAMLTAGEWVQPVDSVRYYGPEFMEAIRKKRIPREVFGMEPIYRANGGLVELGRRLQAMGARVTEHPAFGGVAMRGHGKTSLHYSGRAIDVNTRAGTSALEQRELAPMEKLARSLGFRTIFMAPGHFNHLHVDDGGGGSIVGALRGLLGGAMDLLGDPVGALKKAVEDGLGLDFDNTPVKKIMAAGSRKLVDFMSEKVTGWVSQFFDDGSDQVVGGNLKGNAAANESLVRRMAEGRGWGGFEWTALRNLLMKESGFNNTAQNPTSTAYGMFQFLNSTWASVGARKTSDPAAQAEAGFKYIRQRYGTPSSAWRYHLAHNSYGEGGPVQDVDSSTGGIVPDLHDTGGWVMPGLNVLMNRTGRPEPVINPQTLDALVSIAERGTGGEGDTYHLPVMNGPSARQISEQLEHTRAVASRGGRY